MGSSAKEEVKKVKILNEGETEKALNNGRLVGEMTEEEKAQIRKEMAEDEKLLKEE